MLKTETLHFFSPNATCDPNINRAIGRVQIVEKLDGDPECTMYRVRNIDNGVECVAFADELSTPGRRR